jgi:peptidoglycan hydrolase-like protein with peptidoglycan-binding domain
MGCEFRGSGPYHPPLSQLPDPPDYGYTSAGSSPGPAPYPGTPVRLNSLGKWVFLVQWRLCRWSFNPGYYDGRFGPETMKAVMAFQRHVFLPDTGIVEENTWRKLWNPPHT